MYRIVRKEVMSPVIKLMEIEAPEVAAKARAGQFIILRIDEEGERIPLTIADFNPDRGTITTIFQEVGYTTRRLGAMEAGDTLADFVGPLGQPSEIENYGRVVCVGGGVGVAPVYPIARALKEAGNEVISIIGARTKELLIWEDEMRAVSSELLVATDDGSYGHHGFVTDLLKQVLEERGNISRVWGIGPVIMMRAVAETTRPFGVPTIVSMNPIMVDGTGMCGACRVSVGGETKFACVDGPEFDGHQVDWQLALRRMNMYKDEEERILAYHEGGGCKCH
ncbi:sulfide/dihydroorotate dehydrogenase-like FAD/NAD-binding protein [Moorella sulfitireducens (nom. illeg.)]|uniref:sulfide/dihydroorotate dehydrogenase-like FAD/NAD-binding protein n=1 Tax=Neomoorella sulfitireducens TaxID=2972948 RepID=UPI0021AC0FF3